MGIACEAMQNVIGGLSDEVQSRWLRSKSGVYNSAIMPSSLSTVEEAWSLSHERQFNQ